MRPRNISLGLEELSWPSSDPGFDMSRFGYGDGKDFDSLSMSTVAAESPLYKAHLGCAIVGYR